MREIVLQYLKSKSTKSVVYKLFTDTHNNLTTVSNKNRHRTNDRIDGIK